MNELSDQAYLAAERALNRGDVVTAVEHLRDILTTDPEDAIAHALLALCLLGMKRRHAARHEADIALQINPEIPFAHDVRGRIALAELDLPRAKSAFEQAIALDPLTADYHISLGQYRLAREDENGALECAEKAVTLEPGDWQAQTFRGKVLLELGRVEEAGEAARAVLADNAEYIDALTLLGEAHFKAGDLEQARDVALWALQIQADDDNALELLANIKMRENPLLGLWWRYNNWMSTLGIEKGILVLVFAFIVYFLGQTALRDFGFIRSAAVLQGVWLALVVYTWAGEGIRNHMVNKELEKVKLRPDF